MRRHHGHESSAQKVVRKVARSAGLNKHMNWDTFRHSFATHLLGEWRGWFSADDTRTVRELLGHKACREPAEGTPRRQ